jgi:hypothetical protein
VSASYATTASAATSITFVPTSASYATTASYAANGSSVSASYATTASFATFAAAYFSQSADVSMYIDDAMRSTPNKNKKNYEKRKRLLNNISDDIPIVIATYKKKIKIKCSNPNFDENGFILLEFS